ncbi:MAG: sulfite exporter TauE/SafE family protein [Dehalococcoidia bacterium]
MSWLELLLIPLGVTVGAYGTLVGAGGGFVLVPVLLILYPGEPPAEITAISLAVVFCNAVSGSAAYARLRRIDYRTAAVFVVAALPGSVAGALAVDALPRHAFDIMFGALLLALAAYTLWSAGRPAAIRPRMRGRGVVTRVMPGADPGETYRYSFNLWQGAGYSSGIGVISSLLGIGGGVLHVPIMITLLRFPVLVAVATSQFVLVFIAASGSSVHLINGNLAGDNLLRALLLAAGVIPGAQIGARLAHRLRGPMIARLLVLALLAVGVRLIYTGIA